MFLFWLRQFPWCGDKTPTSVPQPTEGKSLPTNTPAFPPSSFVLPSFAWFCIFFSTGQVLLCTSAGVMHALLYLKVYSWCICGQRCSPCPPTPPPSCSPYNFFKNCFRDNQEKNHHVLLLKLLQKLLTSNPVSTCTLPQIVQPATQSF